MNASAWIALAGAAMVVLTNLAGFAWFLRGLKADNKELKLELKGDLAIMRVEHTALVEKTNVALGRQEQDIARLEQRADRAELRLNNAERTLGGSTNLKEFKD